MLLMKQTLPSFLGVERVVSGAAALEARGAHGLKELERFWSCGGLGEFYDHQSCTGRLSRWCGLGVGEIRSIP